MQGRRPRQVALKLALALLTLVLLASQVGFVLVPLLMPLHIWAARRSHTVGRVAWSLLPAAGLGASAWATVYLTIGEAKPAIWLIPVVVAALAWTLMVVSTREIVRPSGLA